MSSSHTASALSLALFVNSRAGSAVWQPCLVQRQLQRGQCRGPWPDSEAGMGRIRLLGLLALSYLLQRENEAGLRGRGQVLFLDASSIGTSEHQSSVSLSPG